MERPKAAAANVLLCHQHQHQCAQKPVMAYLEMGGAAQNTSIADMIIFECLRVDNEAVQAHEVKGKGEKDGIEF